MKQNVSAFDFEAACKALDEVEVPKVKGIRANRLDLQESVKRVDRTSMLVEDYFDLNNNDDLETAKNDREDEIAKAKLSRIEKIVDLDADSADDILPSYVGKVIMQCPQCMTLFYKDPEDIEHDENDPNIVNVNEICQHCGNDTGYTLIGKVAEETAEPQEEEPTEDTEDEFSFNDEEPSENVEPEEEANVEDNDIEELDLDNLPAEENEEEATEEETGEEEEQEDEEKKESFNQGTGKALTEAIDNSYDGVIELLNEIVDEINNEYGDEIAHIYEDYSGRGMFGAICPGVSGPREVRDELVIKLSEHGRKDLVKCMKQDTLGLNYIYYFPCISVREDLQEDTTSEQAEKVIENPTEADYDKMFNSPDFLRDVNMSDAEVEAMFSEDLDNFDNFNEKCFNENVNEYLKEVYSNINDFKATDCTINKNNVVVEGLITFKSGKTKNTTFMFNKVKNGLLEGYNKDFANTKAFKLEYDKEDNGKTLLTRGISYKYKINESLVNGNTKKY